MLAGLGSPAKRPSGNACSRQTKENCSTREADGIAGQLCRGGASGAEPIRTGSNGASESTGWSAVIWQTLQGYISSESDARILYEMHKFDDELLKNTVEI